MLDDRPLDTCSDDEATLPSHGDDSQVCFVLHKPSTAAIELSPRKAASSAKRKRNAKQDLSPSSLPPCFADEPQECGVWRMEAFKRTWMDIEAHVKETFEVLNTKIFKEIQKFVHDILFCDAQLELYLSPKSCNSGSTNGTARASKQLHAALLRLRNVDSSDHTKTFTQLKMHLKKGNCHVANLFPHNFSSKGGVGAPLHSMMKQIIGLSPDTADMDVLASWHRAESNVKCPIVIIIEDAELCNSAVLAEFMVILSDWIAELPLVLIMGMATSGEAIRKLLPASAARHLHVHNFMFPSPDEYLEGIIKGVLLKPMPLFTMGSDALNFLLTQYLKYDSTVTSFLRALKMACMEHFISQPLSFLSTRLSESPIETLAEPLLRYAMVLPSLWSKQFRTDSDMGDGITLVLSQLKGQKERWISIVNCLLAAGSLVGIDSVKIFLETLKQQRFKTMVNEGNATKNGDNSWHGHNDNENVLSTLLKKLRDTSESTVHKTLTKWIELTESIPEWRAEAQSILQNLASESPPISRVEGLSNGCTNSSRMKQLLSSVTDVCNERQENMASNGGVSETSVSGQRDDLITLDLEGQPSSITRVGVTHAMQKKPSSKVHGKLAANLLEQMMRKHLVPFENLPFHEIFCFRNVAAIKEVLVGEPRRVIQQNVERPLEVLKCQCCHFDNADVSSSMNDSTILFCLAQKHGDQANLFNLYQSFSAVLNSLDSEKQASSRKGHRKSPGKVVQREVDRGMVQARFCKAASELQLVGLFRMAGKKRSDSVQLVV